MFIHVALTTGPALLPPMWSHTTDFDETSILLRVFKTRAYLSATHIAKLHESIHKPRALEGARVAHTFDSIESMDGKTKEW